MSATGIDLGSLRKPVLESLGDMRGKVKEMKKIGRGLVQRGVMDFLKSSQTQQRRVVATALVEFIMHPDPGVSAIGRHIACLFKAFTRNNEGSLYIAFWPHVAFRPEAALEALPGLLESARGIPNVGVVADALVKYVQEVAQETAFSDPLGKTPEERIISLNERIHAKYPDKFDKKDSKYRTWMNSNETRVLLGEEVHRAVAEFYLKAHFSSEVSCDRRQFTDIDGGRSNMEVPMLYLQGVAWQLSKGMLHESSIAWRDLNRERSLLYKRATEQAGIMTVADAFLLEVVDYALQRADGINRQKLSA